MTERFFEPVGLDCAPIRIVADPTDSPRTAGNQSHQRESEDTGSIHHPTVLRQKRPRQLGMDNSAVRVARFRRQCATPGRVRTVILEAATSVQSRDAAPVRATHCVLH